MPQEGFNRLEQLVRQNLELTRKNLANTEKIQKYILSLKVLNIVKTALIVLPIILAIIYLPAAIKNFLGSYQAIFDQIENLKNGSTSAVDPDIIKSLFSR